MGEAIVPELDLSKVPPGAEIQPGFQFVITTTAARHEIREPAPKTFYMWGSPGKYQLMAVGMWGVPVPNEPGKWSAFGLIFQQLEFTVLGGTAPDPPGPPIPGKRRAVILEETLERTPQQTILWDQLRKLYPVGKLEILDDDKPTAKKYVDLCELTQRPVLLVLTETGELIREVSCPGSVAEVQKEVAR